MKYPWKNLLPRYLILIVFMLVVLVPIWGMFTSAFKTSTEVMEGPFSLPSDWSLDNFEQAWRVGRFISFSKQCHRRNCGRHFQRFSFNAQRLCLWRPAPSGKKLALSSYSHRLYGAL